MPASGRLPLARLLGPAAAARTVAPISRSSVQLASKGVPGSSTRALSTVSARGADRLRAPAASVLAAGLRSHRHFASPPPPSSRPTSGAGGRQPASSNASSSKPSRAGLPATSSRLAPAPPTSPELAPLPRRSRPPPKTRSSDSKAKPADAPADESTPSPGFDINLVPVWVRLSIVGIVALVAALEVTLQSADRPSLISHVPDMGIERAIDCWFETNPPPSREEVLAQEKAERLRAKDHFPEEKPLIP